ncbi:MAG: DUF2066 domain-containing protein [Gammaproteobacteria bacterium]|nr:DUF2066 domain-containing protein [Gammaproteobacteria bacterium]
MKNRVSIWVLGLLLLLVAGHASADALDELFVAEAVVTDESSAARNETLSALMAEVLVRVSGDPAIGSQAAARELIADAPSLVRQYRYRSEERNGSVVRLLNATFDRASTERAMRARHLPVWTRRPQVLVWLASERGGKRTLFSLEQNPKIRAALLEHSRARGVPLQLPLMDLEDQAQLTPADLWSDYRPGIELASARYPHQVVLTGRLTARRGDRWVGDWTLIDGDGSRTFATESAALDDTLRSAVDRAQRELAARYAPVAVAGDSGGTLVYVANVRDIAGYGRLNAMLDTLDVVAGRALRQAWSDGLLFDFKLHGSAEQLQRALQQSGMLAAEPPPLAPLPVDPAVQPPVPTGPPAADYHFRLLN